MTKQEIIKQLDDIISIHKEYDNLIVDLQKLFGRDVFDGPVLTFMSKLMDKQIKMVGDSIGDKDGDWISWHIYDNDFGEKKFAATANRNKFKSKPIKTTKDLAEIIMGER